MRIMQLVQRPQRRGAEVFAYDLNRTFERMGFSVKTVYLYRTESNSPLPLHGDDVCLNGTEHHVLERFPKLVPGLLRRTVSEIHSFRPDIVQVNGSRTVKYGAVSKRLSPGNRWKLIYRNIGVPTDWHHWWGSVLVYRSAIMPLMDGVIGVSRESLANAKSLYGLRVPSTVILNGINPERLRVNVDRNEFRAKLGVGSDDFVALYVGHMDEVKRPQHFVSVMSRLVECIPGSRGWLLGDGPERGKAEKLAHDRGIADRVRFFGTRDDVADFMNAADVFVVTSVTEGIPAVVLEAGFIGLPIVATRVGGIPECVQDGATGILVDLNSESAMHEAIQSLAGNTDLRRRMGETARRWIEGNLTIDRIASRYLEFYREIHNDNLKGRNAS